MRPISTVGLIITQGGDEGKVLLAKSWKWGNLFTLPGGKVEEGESLREAAKREAREELGIEVEPVALVGVGEYLREGNYHKKAHFIFHHILCYYKGGQLALNEEVDEARWFSIEETLTSPLVDPHTRMALKQFKEGKCRLPLSQLQP